MKAVAPPIVDFPKTGNNCVEMIEFELNSESSQQGRININPDQFFDNVPIEVWEYNIGGYQVAHKWLKDRKGRSLSFDELKTYGDILAALAETIRVQAEIDTALQ